MKTLQFIKPAILVIVIPILPGMACTPQTADKSPAKPNILFIYADDWGWGDLACHGHPELKTPNIDKLASEGTDFQRFTVGSPVCSPSRATILTGQYPARHLIHSAISNHENNLRDGIPNWLDPGVTMLPRLLKEAGYTTGHFGKWHLSLHGPHVTPDTPWPKEYGFDTSYIFSGPGPLVWENSSYAEFKGMSHEPVPASYITAAAVEHAIRFITEAGDKPFFVNLWIHETHTRISATEEDKKAYPDIPEPQLTYYSAVTRADRLIGEVLATLKKLGLEDNTLVIFSSDNGPEDPHPDVDHVRYESVGETGGLRGRKRSLYLGGVNTPFIVCWPGHTPSGKVDKTSVISGVDMLPTLLSAAKVPMPANYQPDGVNVLNAFKGERFDRQQPLFWEWRGPHNKEANWVELAMLDGDWALLISDKQKRTELYNVVSDRSQQNNLAQIYAERTSAMLKELRQWKTTLPESNKTYK